MSVSDSLSVTVNAPAADVIAFLRDIANQSSWFPGNLESEVLETNDDGTVARARLTNDVKVAKDTFEVVYHHSTDGYSWKLAEATKIQKDNSGSWKVVDKGGKSEATMTLSIDTTLPLPGFVQKKTLKDTLKNTTKALQDKF